MTVLRSVLILIIWAVGAKAEPITVHALRSAVAAGDFEVVDTGLASAQVAFLAGDISADDMRALYIALSRSAPETVRFVEAWLEKDPDNHRAQIARAWSLHNGAGFIRRGGNGYGHQMASEMYREVRELATTAYKSNPDLIPASDALVRSLGRQDEYTPIPAEVLDQVLTKHPNYGSILRFISQLRRYPAQIIEGFCGSVAEDFSEARRDIVKYRCMLNAALQHNLEGLDSYVENRLWTLTDPELELGRVAFFVQRTDHRTWTDEQIDWASDVLLTHPVDQFEAVNLYYTVGRFEWILQTSLGRLSLVKQEYKRKRYPEISEFLAHDPYNIDLLDIASDVEFSLPMRVVQNEDGKEIMSSAAPDLSDAKRAEMRAGSRAQTLDFARRRVLASPYSGAFWESYARAVAQMDRPHSMFDGDAAMINAIVLTENPIILLKSFVHTKALQYDHLTGLEARSAEERAQLANWQEVLESTNLPQAVLCPGLRAHVLLEAICDYYDAEPTQCQPTDELSLSRQARLIADAQDAPECKGILAAETPEELWYEMIDFDAALNP